MLKNGELSPEFANPMSPWIMEIGSLLIWLVMFIYFWRQSKRTGELSFGTLIFLSATSMSWLEFYADWGGYCLYNPKFLSMPWGSTWWTAPEKPWFVLVTYGWYYYFAVTSMLFLVAKFRSRFPNWGHVSSVFIVAFPFFYLWDFWVETLASMTGWWVYPYHIGPAIALAKGNFPYLHPIVLYALSGTLLCLAMSYRRANGSIWFESSFGVEKLALGKVREAARLLVWCIFMNLLYMSTFVIPVNLVRETIGAPSAIIP